MIEFEKLVINDDDDITVPVMDKTSTVGGFLKNLVEKEHRDNYLKDRKIFIGTVFRIPGLYQQSNYDYNQLAAARQTSARDYIYKVRVPEIDSAFHEIPNTYDGTPEDKSIIDTYTDFRAPSDIKFRVGDKVEVTYDNLRTFQGGVILRRIPEALADKLLGSYPVGSSAPAAETAETASPSPSAGYGDTKNILLVGDSHTSGHFGQNLEKLFKSSGKTVDRVSHTNITAAHYLNNRVLVGTSDHVGEYDVAKKNNYDVVVVLLSTNDASGCTTSSCAATKAAQIKKLMDLLNGKKKIWVSGPKLNDRAATTYGGIPGYKTFDINKRIELLWQEGVRIIGAQNSIDSRPCTESLKESTGGDIHYYNAPAAQWASCIYKKITSMI